jgi:hypothetical protein
MLRGARSSTIRLSPELLGRWYGPKRWSLVVCEVIYQWAADGSSWRGAPAVPFDLEDFRGESLVTMNLVEDRGRTKLTQPVLYPSKDLRDGNVSSTEHSATESYERLDEYLASIS